MNIPNYLRPGLTGAVIGAAALAIVGFSWGGWVTGESAEQMASDRAEEQVIQAMVPICLAQSKQDPSLTQTLAHMADAREYARHTIVAEAGWATMPGSEEANKDLARACADSLEANLQ